MLVLTHTSCLLNPIGCLLQPKPGSGSALSRHHLALETPALLGADGMPAASPLTLLPSGHSQAPSAQRALAPPPAAVAQLGATFDPFSPDARPLPGLLAALTPAALPPSHTHRAAPHVAQEPSSSISSDALAFVFRCLEAQELAAAARVSRAWRAAALNAWATTLSASVRLAPALPMSGRRALEEIMRRAPNLEHLALVVTPGEKLTDGDLCTVVNAACAPRLKTLALTVEPTSFLSAAPLDPSQSPASPGPVLMSQGSEACNPSGAGTTLPPSRCWSITSQRMQSWVNEYLPALQELAIDGGAAGDGPSELMLASRSLRSLRVAGCTALVALDLKCSALEDISLQLGMDDRAPLCVNDYRTTRYMPLVSGSSQVSGPQGAAARLMRRVAESSLPRLRRVHVAGPWVTDKALEALVSGEPSQWTALCVNHAPQVTADGVTKAAIACRSLVHLDLSGCCAVSDDALSQLAAFLPGLQLLYLAHCQLLSRSAVQLVVEKLPHLRLLDLGFSLVDKPRGGGLAERNAHFDRLFSYQNDLSSPPSAPCYPLSQSPARIPSVYPAGSPPQSGARGNAFRSPGALLAATPLMGPGSVRDSDPFRSLGQPSSALPPAMRLPGVAAHISHGSVSISGAQHSTPVAPAVVGKLGSCKRSLLNEFDPTAVGASQTLELRSASLRALSLWGCTKIRALKLDCPGLVRLNVNQCRALEPQRVDIQAPLQTVTAAGSASGVPEKLRALMRRAQAPSPIVISPGLRSPPSAERAAGATRGKRGLFNSSADAPALRAAKRIRKQSSRRDGSDPFSDSDDDL